VVADFHSDGFVVPSNDLPCNSQMPLPLAPQSSAPSTTRIFYPTPMIPTPYRRPPSAEILVGDPSSTSHSVSSTSTSTASAAVVVPTAQSDHSPLTKVRMTHPGADCADLREEHLEGVGMGVRRIRVRVDCCNHRKQARAYTHRHHSPNFMFRYRTLRRANRQTADFFSSHDLTSSTSTSVPPNPPLGAAPVPSDAPSRAGIYPPYPPAVLGRTHGRTIRSPDTDVGGRRGGTGGDFDVDLADKDALPAYDGLKGGPPKYDETEQ
jgi:hypothetical protein